MTVGIQCLELGEDPGGQGGMWKKKNLRWTLEVTCGFKCCNSSKRCCNSSRRCITSIKHNRHMSKGSIGR
ncbi:hypothetical protein A2U01_0102872 [Trifolium medium]|uniref:Uncharacterized protein n=1 Tax=Trifolium medium TaxID=97028 RepID=A0A392UZZ5_9FABA|nr:hypothetical protein [Trifolium medium]